MIHVFSLTLNKNQPAIFLQQNIDPDNLDNPLAAGNLEFSSFEDDGGSSSGGGSSRGNSGGGGGGGDGNDLLERFGIGEREEVVLMLPEVSVTDEKHANAKFACMDSEEDDDGSSDDMIDGLNYEYHRTHRSSMDSEMSSTNTPMFLDITTDMIEEIEDDDHHLNF